MDDLSFWLESQDFSEPSSVAVGVSDFDRMLAILAAWLPIFAGIAALVILARFLPWSRIRAWRPRFGWDWSAWRGKLLMLAGLAVMLLGGIQWPPGHISITDIALGLTWIWCGAKLDQA